MNFTSLFTLCAMMVVMAVAHTIMMTPVPRQATVHTNTGNYQCGTTTNIQATYKRGQEVPIKWGRNNHHGGFSALSVRPLSEAGGAKANDPAVIKAFNDPANIFHTSCYLSSSTCRSNGNNKFGMGGDGTDFQKTICSSTFTVPEWLDDGEYVMKWIVFGNGDSFGVRNMAHTDYSNCHNFKVSGGPGPVDKPKGNKHIDFKLEDNAINEMNQRTGSKVPQGQCMFSGGAVNPNTCVGVKDKKSPKCTGPVSDLARCGGGTADTRKECLLFNKEDQTDGGDLYNFMIGLPDYHPDYDGKFLLLSDAPDRPNSRPVALAGHTKSTPAPSSAPKPKPTSAPKPKPTSAAKPTPKPTREPTSAPKPSQKPTKATDKTPKAIFWSKHPNRYMAVAGKIEDGSDVEMSDTPQKWVFTACGNIQVEGTSKCLDVTKGKDQDGTHLQVWQCGCDNENQLFEKLKWGGYRWKGSNKCLDVTGGSAEVGTKVQIQECPDWSNMQFGTK